MEEMVAFLMQDRLLPVDFHSIPGGQLSALLERRWDGFFFADTGLLVGCVNNFMLGIAQI